MALSVLVLVGWALDLPAFRSILPGVVSMNPMTALAFALAAASLWLQRIPVEAGRPQRLGMALALGVVTIGLLKLVAVTGALDVGIDQWLFAGSLADADGARPNRMAPNTAFNFVLLGMALLAVDWTTPRGRRPAEYLALAVFLVALLALVGYAYGVGQLTRVRDAIPMAPHTALAFALLAFGVFVARSHAGMMAVAASDSPGGMMMRRLLPMVAAAILLLGWLRLEGEYRGLYGLEMGVTLYTLVNISVLAFLLWWSAKSLHRAHADRARLDARERESNDRVKNNEQRVRAIIETAADAFVSIDDEDRIIDWNRQAEAIFGWPREAALGKRMSELIVPPQHRAAHARRMQHFAIPGEGSALDNRIEITALRRDCGEFPVELSMWPVETQHGVHTFNAFIRDISERREAEARILALNADLSTKAAELQIANAELGSFSYSISHDLRAPLRHIDGYARMLQEDAAELLDADMRRYLDVISDSARRMGALIDDLLAFSRLGRKELDRVAVDMDALAEVALDEARAGRDPVAAVDIRALPAARGDPALLRQVWVNLLSNALKYSAARGAEARVEVSGETDGIVNRYRVRDNGVGFDMRYADKLFGVFQRLHAQDEFEGTGVGLAIVQRIVTRHGGRITAEAELGRCATFTFELPHLEPAMEQRA